VLTYRCFILNGAGDISEQLSIECSNDEEAITQAGAVLDNRSQMATIEVWDGARLVKRLQRVRP
jgi:hypothetical protein